MASKLIVEKKLYGNASDIEVKYKDVQKLNREFNSFLRDGRLELAKRLISQFKLKGTILEQGSGHSWLTAELSKHRAIKHCYCCDFSAMGMRKIAPMIFKKLKAKEEKITRILGDFAHIPVPDHSIDFIIFEAAFHHVPDYEATLAEMRRILKPSGIIICTRERVLPKGFESLRSYDEHFKSGILERIFTLAEWRYIAEMNYFHFSTEPFYFYRKKGKRLKDWAKLLLDKNPFFRSTIARKTGSFVFLLRPKPYKELRA